MKRISFFRRGAGLALLAATLAALHPLPASAQSTHPASPDTLTVMTYNLKFASPNPPNAWPVRRPLVREVIQQIAPDVFGTQEGLYAQLKEIASDLPDYEWIGLGREGGSRGEFMAVFYRKARFEPLAYDHFWLSDTPEVIGSSTWGNRNRRMVTWVKFLDRQTQREFFLWNTHFDNQVQAAREQAAKLVRERVAALDTKLPLILTGDFNAAGGTNAAYKILTDGGFFADTWMTAKERQGEGLNTSNGFQAIRRNGVRIDWILTRGEVVADSTEIVTFSRNGQFPSDHFPVVARMRFAEAK
ncbi:MAG: endonuclease/exonuclease/phosphatase family protein [Verrucomicrobia bacterium]|jgi:endonuclease/exonuclease/phosphatase family metal-dependent hydrolase|nr:endonuclease/exonuclease/phosphatase family protein [Verrucomicrobiota bacterium]